MPSDKHAAALGAHQPDRGIQLAGRRPSQPWCIVNLMVNCTCAHERRQLDLVWPALLPLVHTACVRPGGLCVGSSGGWSRGPRRPQHVPPHRAAPKLGERRGRHRCRVVGSGPSRRSAPRGCARHRRAPTPTSTGFQPQATLPSWQSPSGPQATAHPDSTAGTPAGVSPAYQAASPRLAAFAAPAAQLPPEILVDRHLVRVGPAARRRRLRGRARGDGRDRRATAA